MSFSKLHKYFLFVSLIGFTTFFVSSCDDSSSNPDDGIKPKITSFSPSTVYQGSSLTLTGLRFGSVRGTGYISFNGKQLSDNNSFQKWTDTEIIVVLPADAVTGPLTVTNSAGTSNSVTITVIALPADAPTITDLDQIKVAKGKKLGIYGKNFGSAQAGGYIQFTGAKSDSIVSWADGQIVVIVPETAQSGPLSVVRGGVTSNTFQISILEDANKINTVLIPKGSFKMGYEEGGDVWDAPIHDVTITYDFYMTKTEITQSLYKLLMGGNPSQNKSSVNNPVEQVTFIQACEFCNLASDREKFERCYLITGEGDEAVVQCNFGANGYRLPTEAEWEYACRAGSNGQFSGVLSDFAWYSDNAGGNVHEVGTKQANAFGLYDMLGNVMEWCWDYHNIEYYTKSPQNDPRGPIDGVDRITRGGSYQNSDEICTYGKRDSYGPTIYNFNLGFRIVRKK